MVTVPLSRERQRPFLPLHPSLNRSQFSGALADGTLNLAGKHRPHFRQLRSEPSDKAVVSGAAIKPNRVQTAHPGWETLDECRYTPQDCSTDLTINHGIDF